MIMTGKHDGRYEHIKLEDKNKFDPKSFRTIDPGRRGCTRVLVGCERNKWDAEDKRCDIGMKPISVMLEKACFKKDLAEEARKYKTVK